MNYLNPTVLTFILYIVLMIAIGVYAYRATTDFSDYILGGRSFGSLVTAFSAGASDMSGWLLMGLPGAIYLSGLSEAWIGIGLVIGAWLNWLFVAGRLRIHTEVQHNAMTLPDYFNNRFDDRKRILRISSALIILIFFSIYCASGMVAGARLFESLFGMDYQTALWLSAIATIIYVTIGGFLAISWTDTFQAGLMLFALFLTPIFAYLAVSNDGYDVINYVQTVRPEAMQMLQGLSGVAIISSLAWGLGYFGQPHILVRFMAAKNVKTITMARRIGMSWMIICLLGSVGIGFFGIAFFQANPDLAAPVTANSETVFLQLTQILFNPWVAGVILAAFLAAVMSTLSSQLLVCSTTITEDFYKVFIRKNASQNELIWIGRIMVVVIASVAIGMASNPESKVLGLVSYAWAGFGAALGPLILLSLMWKRMTLSGALAGMIIGAVTVIFWKNLLGDTGVYEIIPGFIFSTIAIVLVSLITKTPSSETMARFEEADRIYHQHS